MAFCPDCGERVTHLELKKYGGVCKKCQADIRNEDFNEHPSDPEPDTDED